ncbi:nuclear transport factor 2 family protein [Microbulbifer celer]|uniref:DUF4440 domain-containing protein n=1 Tax=Microbulbifer celer TaxID=435905 RepID=A0ABW3U958_9GAMM|nr:DUF4440 domain-containing protein [Microbulbifer celer]UFN56364.1 DUF4440 domain-containing protein [Microbulbifer celer]
MELREKIINLEKTLLTFEVRRSPAKLNELLSENFKEIGASGACSGLAEILEHLPRERDWSATTQDWEFRALSEGIVQVMYKACIEKPGSGTPVYSRRTSIWRLEGESWKMVYHQGTAVVPFELEG